MGNKCGCSSSQTYISLDFQESLQTYLKSKAHYMPIKWTEQKILEILTLIRLGNYMHYPETHSILVRRKL